MTKRTKTKAKKPIVIAEFEVPNKPGWVYPLERDSEGLLADGKRVGHAQALIWYGRMVANCDGSYYEAKEVQRFLKWRGRQIHS